VAGFIFASRASRVSTLRCSLGRERLVGFMAVIIPLSAQAATKQVSFRPHRVVLR
jgi:hypothetical protein